MKKTWCIRQTKSIRLVVVMRLVLKQLDNKHLRTIVETIKLFFVKIFRLLFEHQTLILSSDGRFKIRIQKFGKDARKYHFSVPLYTVGSSVYNFNFPELPSSNEGTKEVKKIVGLLFETDLCVDLSILPHSIFFSKSQTTNWNEISPKIIEIIFNILSEKYPNPKPTSKKNQSKQIESAENFILNHSQFHEN